jgi:Sec-independent protein translocase protein TatA
MGRSLGKGMREFKEGVSNADADEPVAAPTPAPPVELPPPVAEPPAQRIEQGERETIS